MEGDVTVFRTNSGGYVVTPVGQRGWGGGGRQRNAVIYDKAWLILGFFFEGIEGWEGRIC